MTELILHWCEVCGKEENLTSEQGYEAGWDFPPSMGKVGWVCPRTCSDCTIDKTAWFALQRGQELTETQEKAVQRMTLEREEQE